MSSSEKAAERPSAKKLKGEPVAQSVSKPLLRHPARAELIWDGKYDAEGRRVAPQRVALPFQTVETVNESAQDRQRALSFGPGFHEEEWRNRLIWGDKKYVLLACCRFRRHRVRCFDGIGGVSWRDGSLHASSSLRLYG
jgi:hypothetical protein